MKTLLRLKLIMGMLLFLSTLQTASAYYDPAPQRWISRDLGQEDNGINLSSAFLNEPVNYVDLWGEKPVIVGGEIWDLQTNNCLGYATDNGSYLSAAPGNSLKDLLEKRGWKCKKTKGKCKGKKGESVFVLYIYDTTGFPQGADPWSAPWPTSGPDIHAIKKCSDDRWRYVPSICPLTTTPVPSDGLKNPDSYWPEGKIPTHRYCCTKPKP